MRFRKSGLSNFFPNIASIIVYAISSLTTLMAAALFGPSAWGEIAIFFQVVAYAVAIGSFGIPTYISINFSKVSPGLRTAVLQICLLFTGIVGLVLFSVFFFIFNLTITHSNFYLYFSVLLLTAISISFYEFQLGLSAAILRFKFVSAIRIINVFIPGVLTVSCGFLGIGMNWVLISILVSYILINSFLLYENNQNTFSKILSFRGLRKYSLIQFKNHELSKAIKISWSLHKSLILALLAFKCDLLFVVLKSGTADLAIYSIAVLCADVSILFANGFFLKNLILLPPAEVSKKAKIFEKETMVSLGAAVLLSTVMLCLLVLAQSLAIFDEYSSVLSIFFMLLIGSPFLVILKMRLPGLIRAQESFNLNRLLLIVILGKATILIYPTEGYSTLAAGLITSGSYLVACLYLLLQFMRRATRNDSSSH